jgi:hypothetical protein
MRSLRIAIVLLAVLTGACASGPVKLGVQGDTPVPTGAEREVNSEACGFQLLLFFPISINGRFERAYDDLKAQAGGDVITDVQISERWFYGLVGTGHCTTMRAKAVKSGT